jgi:hypothetical protein
MTVAESSHVSPRGVARDALAPKLALLAAANPGAFQLVAAIIEGALSARNTRFNELRSVH